MVRRERRLVTGVQQVILEVKLLDAITLAKSQSAPAEPRTKKTNLGSPHA
jgi:hypothetical protein